VQETEISATFGPVPQDLNTLSKTSAATLDALFRHPIASNLSWLDVTKLFEKIGTINQKSHNEVAFDVAGEHHAMRKPHNKDLTKTEVMDLRHMLSRAGWSPVAAVVAPAEDTPEAATPPDPMPDLMPDLMIVMDHHEARIYHLDLSAVDIADHVIKPYDPHHFLHHLTHKDQDRERGQRAPEDNQFYQDIEHAVADAGRIVLVGHGHGHSNAAHHLAEFLREHHPDVAHKLAGEVAADLSALTEPQLLELGRKALAV
jgi:hypothetical protein